MCYIDGKLKERFDPKRLRLYEDADDAIRDELMTKFGMQIDDSTGKSNDLSWKMLSWVRALVESDLTE